MKRRAFLASGAAVALTGLSPARYARAATSDATALAQIEALAEAAMGELRTPGLTFGVVRNGRVALKRGLGVKEIGKAEPVTTQTLFHMASLVKPFVATILAQRMQQGRVRLEQRLEDVLPEFRLEDPRGRQITLENLLTHSSGLPDVEEFHWDKPETDEGALMRYLAGLSGTRLLFAPGQGFTYSDIGFEVLARVIEVLDGVPFETSMRRTIFEPLKMAHSTMFYPEADKAQVATPHVPDVNGIVRPCAVFPYNRPHAGSSTLLSNIDDMLRWVQFNLFAGTRRSAGILSPETVLSMRAPREIKISAERFPPGMKPALSWFVMNRGGRAVFAHPGNDLGFVSICLFCPEGRYGLVAVANCETERGTDGLRRFAFSAIDAGLLAPHR
jgi:CubicO group peptidase (beta-lactamase class C family)